MTELEYQMYLVIKDYASSAHCKDGFDCGECPLANLCYLAKDSDCFYDLLTELYNETLT